VRQRWRDLPAGFQDAVIGVAFAIVWFAAYRYWRDNGWQPRHPETYELAGLWSALALGLRRVAPWPLLLVTAIAYPLLYQPPLQTEFHLLPILIAGFAATSSTSRVRSLVAAAVAMAAVLALSSRTAFPLQAVDWSQVVFHEFATAVVIGLGVVVHEQRRTAAALAARNAELERLRHVEAQQAIADERTRIARELHDVAAHHLTAVIIRAQAADRVAATRPEVASEAVPWIAATAREALAAMRQTVRVLRSDNGSGPAALAPGPSLADLPSIAARVGHAGLPVSLRVDDPLPLLDRQAELAAVRIAQEALTNALRHAGAGQAVVSLRAAEGGVLLDVEDDGATTDPPGAAIAGAGGAASRGHGLIGMRERAASCGGRLLVDRGALGGWRVRAWLPSAAVPRPV
jgi:signal transduction histidine kinase